MTKFDTAALRMGWYVNYGANSNPPHPNGAEYAPIISLTQIGADDYTYSPNDQDLNDAIAGNPGAVWFIGNEPDRRDVQDDIEPHVYAKAYHDLYNLIKTADPTAKIFAGTIVQPTPIRLQYLDMVLTSYEDEYGAPMPVDGWSVHNFILNEVNKDCDNNSWGAGIPPGIDACYGEVIDIQDNDSMDLFTERLERFRRWMLDNGYADVPLYVSEYGVLMPEDLGFDDTRVNTFMDATFDYMRTKTDPVIGYADDGNRLVQRWSWYSTGTPGDPFNGYLFEPDDPGMLSSMGANFAGYTTAISEEVDIYPSRIFSEPAAPFSTGETVTVTVKAVIANSGNLVQATGPVTARFYDGDPDNGGIQFGSNHEVTLAGCGDHQILSEEMADLPPGAHPVYVVVEEAVGETNVENNVGAFTVLVATERSFLPIVNR